MKCYGVMGGPWVVKSKSPVMHNAAFAAEGIDACYAAFPVPDGLVEAALEGMKALGIAGLNVTVPHKETVARLMDRLEGEAAELNAVNTVHNRDGLLVGHNTDVGGFMASLELAGFEPNGKCALLIGAGGAARAVAFAMARAGSAPLLVAGRNLEKTAKFCEQVGGEPISLERAADEFPRASLLVNATSVSDPGEGPELAGLVARMAGAKDLELVVDINYGRKKNIWLDLAGANGASFRDGLDMLALQARLSFMIWTGRDPGAELFLKALKG